MTDLLRPGAVRRCRLMYRRWLETGDRRCMEASLRLAGAWSIGTLELR